LRNRDVQRPERMIAQIEHFFVLGVAEQTKAGGSLSTSGVRMPSCRKMLDVSDTSVEMK
jgi:hypothetical protein